MVLTREEEIIGNKQLRKEIDEIITKVNNLPRSRERSLTATKLEEGSMWLGKDLGRLFNENPYPDSKNPETGDKLAPKADGLKN